MLMSCDVISAPVFWQPGYYFSVFLAGKGMAIIKFPVFTGRYFEGWLVRMNTRPGYYYFYRVLILYKLLILNCLL